MLSGLSQIFPGLSPPPHLEGGYIVSLPHFNIGAEIVVLRAKILSSSYRIKYDVLTTQLLHIPYVKELFISSVIQEAPEHQGSLKSFCLQSLGFSFVTI